MGTEFYSDLQASIDVKVHGENNTNITIKKYTWCTNIHLFNISENVLIPIHKTALIAVDLTIGCKTFDKTPVDYCRFVRPDGKGNFSYS